MFALKLFALAWATRVRLSAHAIAAACSGAVALAVAPHVFEWTGAHDASAAIGIAVIALSAIQERSVVTSNVELDPWGATVLRRTVRAIWTAWALLLALHVLFWSIRCQIELAPLLPLLPLVAVRTIRCERRLWVLVVATLVVTAMALPSALSTTALVGALALVARAFAPAADVDTSVAVPIATAPYRSPPEREAIATRVERADGRRLLAGALLCAYLSVWTLGWTGGEWPAHIIALDLALIAGSIFVVRRALRTRIPLCAAIATGAHYASTVVPMPRSALAVGATSVALGFALLAGCVGAAWWWRPRPPSERTDVAS